MRKFIILLILITLPLFILANSSSFGYHPLKSGQNPQMLNDRAYRINEQTIQNWNYSTTAWRNAYNYQYYYAPDNAANPDSIAYYTWNPDTSVYLFGGNYYFTYDASGQHVTRVVLSRTYSGIEYIYYQSTFTYTPEGYLVGFQEWSTDPNNPVPIRTMTIDYTSTSNYEIWNWEEHNDDWVPQWDHQTFQWDTQGRIIQETTQISLDSLSWVNGEQLAHEYIAGDTTTGTIFVNSFSHQLPFMMIGNFNGPYYGKQSQMITKKWASGQWVNQNKQNFNYNGNNILTDDIIYKWQGGNWVNQGKNNYTYDTNDNLTDIVYAIWSNPNWINDTHYIYNYSQFTANLDNVSTPLVQVLSAYPNPFLSSEAVTIKAKLAANEKGSLTIYNLKGQMVKVFEISAKSPNLKWNGRDDKNQTCAAGIYLYRLSTNGHNETKKLVILK
jgi:hypothetical protein